MDIIYSYTAQQAVADGILAEVPRSLCQDVGFRFPVRITQGVQDLLDIDEDTGNAWDMLWVAKLAIQHAPAKEWLVEFQLLLKGKFHTLWAALDTTSGPAIHIFQPSEY